MLLRVLIATQEPRYAKQLAQLLRSREDDIHLRTVGPSENLWHVLRTGALDLLVVDEQLLADGLESAIQEIRSLPEAPEVVIFSERDDASHRAELIAAEAFAVLNPSTSWGELVEALKTILERRAEQARTEFLAARAAVTKTLEDFTTESPVMREFLALVQKVASSDSTLLILGETGLGKEYMAKAIHADSPRRDSPFVAVNCSALSEGLLESELFGHAEGAFTGAQRARRGYFERAHKGTVFIDELGELSPKLQVKLLRVIQERRIQAVGSEEEIEVDVRIIAATNRDLVGEMKAGRFRADLYYRLSVVTLEIPPLRVRHEDVQHLVESHVAQFGISMNRGVRTVSGEAMQQLIRYRWPGNVRELINVIERAVLLCDTATIESRDLPEELRDDASDARTSAQSFGQAAPQASSRDESGCVLEEGALDDVDILECTYSDARIQVMAAFEQRYVQAALKRAHGRIADAAKIAGMNPRSLYEKMQKYGIKKEYFKMN